MKRTLTHFIYFSVIAFLELTLPAAFLDGRNIEPNAIIVVGILGGVAVFLGASEFRKRDPIQEGFLSAPEGEVVQRTCREHSSKPCRFHCKVLYCGSEFVLFRSDPELFLQVQLTADEGVLFQGEIGKLAQLRFKKQPFWAFGAGES